MGHEAVHGKATILQKMYGEYENKFPQARAPYLYMYTHPGKRLNFMGNEIGQLREWDEKREQDWELTKYPMHDSFAGFMKDLCSIYQNSPALYELDYFAEGFRWIDCHQEDRCIYVYERTGKSQKMVVLLNFSDQAQNYLLDAGKYRAMELVISADNERYGCSSLYR